MGLTDDQWVVLITLFEGWCKDDRSSPLGIRAPVHPEVAAVQVQCRILIEVGAAAISDLQNISILVYAPAICSRACA